MAYLGTTLNKDMPASATACTTNFDNMDYILGTFSTLLNLACAALPDPMNSTTNFFADLSQLLVSAQKVANTTTNSTTSSISKRDSFGTYPNPFFNYQSSTQIPNSANLISK